MISRKLGRWTVEIDGEHILVFDDWLTNHGIIYAHAIERFKAGQDIQVIGMDSGVGMTKAVQTFIHSYIKLLPQLI